MAVEFKDNSAQIKVEMSKAVLAGLEACGMTAETYAKGLAPRDTGRLINSITHRVIIIEKACYIGTNVEYAIWQEIGTGIYASEGGGRQTPWFFINSEGRARMTRGSHAHHFLKKAASEHSGEYKKLMKDAGS